MCRASEISVRETLLSLEKTILVDKSKYKPILLLIQEYVYENQISSYNRVRTE